MTVRKLPRETRDSRQREKTKWPFASGRGCQLRHYLRTRIERGGAIPQLCTSSAVRHLLILLRATDVQPWSLTKEHPPIPVSLMSRAILTIRSLYWLESQGGLAGAIGRRGVVQI